MMTVMRTDDEADAVPEMNQRTDGRTDGRADGRTDGRADGRTDGRMDGWTDGRMDGRTDGRTGRRDALAGRHSSIHICVYKKRRCIFCIGPSN